MKTSKFIVALFLLGALQASAQGSFKDGPHFAYPRGDDVRSERAGFGWQVAYEWNDFLSTELSISRHTDKINDVTVLPAPFSSDFDLEVVPIVLSMRAGYPIGPALLYAGGGFGWYYMRGDAGPMNQSIQNNRGALPAGLSDLRMSVSLDNEFAYHAAVGLEWLLTAKWEIFAEYRWIWLDSTVTYKGVETRPATGGALAFNRTASSTSERFDYDHQLLRIGVNYRF